MKDLSKPMFSIKDIEIIKENDKFSLETMNEIVGGAALNMDGNYDNCTCDGGSLYCKIF